MSAAPRPKKNNLASSVHKIAPVLFWPVNVFFVEKMKRLQFANESAGVSCR